jgi:hypothetical protein
MRARVEIQNIEDMRRRAGIEDVELREAIRGLRVGAFVKLTLLAGEQGAAGETLLVRITSIRGDAFRGKLAGRPTSAGLSGLRVGLALAFTGSHIHSLPTGRANRER